MIDSDTGAGVQVVTSGMFCVVYFTWWSERWSKVVSLFDGFVVISAKYFIEMCIPNWRPLSKILMQVVRESLQLCVGE